MICPVLLKYPDEFISNTKVVRNRSTNPDTPPTHVSYVHDTSDMISPPPDTLFDNHPELAVHPQMNFRSEQRALHCVRTPLTFHTSCHASVCYDCLYLLCLFPLSFGRPRGCRRLHRCRVRLRRRRPYAYRRATRQAEPFSSPDIAYLSVLSCTRHNCCCYDAFLFNCIACFCRPLMYLSKYYAACCIYLIQQ